MTFGNYLKDLRNYRRMTQTELAQKSGISISLISRVESGNRNVPKPETILILADALQVSPTQMMIAAGYVFPQTDRELLAHIERLSEKEQQLVLDFILNFSGEPDESVPPSSPRGTRNTESR